MEVLKLVDSCQYPCPRRNTELLGSWVPTSGETTKINSDGAWEKESRKAWAEKLDQCFCSSEAEGQALCKGMMMAQKLNIGKAIFEVDAMEVYKAVSFGAEVGDFTDWCASWLESAIDLLRRNHGWSVQFTSREANKAANYLAGKIIESASKGIMGESMCGPGLLDVAVREEAVALELKDCISMLDAHPEWQLGSINRESNGVADWLARKARVDCWE
ncbi:hypothetical protein QQ045_010923 [Rhodiola kirilowii]